MAIKTWPATLRISSLDLSCEHDVQLNLYRNGSVDVYGLPGARWAVTLGFDSDVERRQRPQLEALLMSLGGGRNQLSMPANLGRPVPNGDLRGAPTLQSAVVAGNVSVALTNCNGGLRAGDMIGIVDQVVMVEADVEPSGGNMTVTFNPPLRTSRGSGTPIVWNRPTILWIPRSSIAGPFPYRPGGVRPGLPIELVEIY